MNTNYFFSGNQIVVENHDQGVKRLVLKNPNARNALNVSMRADMVEALTQLSKLPEDSNFRLLVIQGKGPVFCAGADLYDMKHQAEQSMEENLKDAHQLATLFALVASMPVPVLTVVQGAAIGGGLGLAVCSDYVLASESAIFGTSEVLLGLIPAVISPYIIRKVGLSKASHWMLTGKKIGAQEAIQYGLVNEIEADNLLLSKLEVVQKEFLSAGPHAARETKKLILANAPLPTWEHQMRMANAIAEARCHPEAQAGLKSFFDKTNAPWQQLV